MSLAALLRIITLDRDPGAAFRIRVRVGPVGHHADGKGDDRTRRGGDHAARSEPWVIVCYVASVVGLGGGGERDEKGEEEEEEGVVVCLHDCVRVCFVRMEGGSEGVFVAKRKKRKKRKKRLGEPELFFKERGKLTACGFFLQSKELSICFISLFILFYVSIKSFFFGYLFGLGDAIETQSEGRTEQSDNNSSTGSHCFPEKKKNWKIYHNLRKIQNSKF